MICANTSVGAVRFHLFLTYGFPLDCLHGLNIKMVLPWDQSASVQIQGDLFQGEGIALVQPLYLVAEVFRLLGAR